MILQVVLKASCHGFLSLVNQVRRRVGNAPLQLRVRADA
jgi:hypothetical protein